MSSKITEITDLFAQLAVNLKTVDPTAKNEDEEQGIIDLSISNLNRSFNLECCSRVRVLDTVLSLMCFNAPQVYDTCIQYLVSTLVTVLSSSVSCKLLNLQNAEYMRVGGEISKSDFAELIESCADVFSDLEQHGTSYQSLVYALVKAAVSASSFHYGVGLVPILDTNQLERGKPAVSKLLCHLPSDLQKNEEIPLRLLFWYLDPMILKSDVSNILKDSIDRPFICLETEFHEKMEWHSVLMCLAFCPAMFVETRALLHNWFLMTGLASVLELETKLVSSILDVISRPMRWGVSMEAGLNLPSSCAYFAYNNNLLRTLEGPILRENLPHLVYITNKIAHHPHVLDHKSPWAMAMNFPNWYYFASTLLFRGKSIQYKAAIYDKASEMESAYLTAAAQYIAWILDPTSEPHQELLVELLTKVSESWVLKKCSEKNFKQQQSVSRKKLKKPKTPYCEDDYALVQQWLEEFEIIYINYLRKTCKSCSQGITSQKNVLLRRISLGIVIGYSHVIDEDGSQLLLHYSATGKLWSQGIKSSAQNFINYYNYKEAVGGARLVFDLIDIVESISGSLFESEESVVDFIYSVKLRVGRYLLCCVKRLVEIEKGDKAFVLRDLYSRLGQWRLIGKDVSNKDFDEIIDILSRRLSSI